MEYGIIGIIKKRDRNKRINLEIDKTLSPSPSCLLKNKLVAYISVELCVQMNNCDGSTLAKSSVKRR